MTFLSIDHFSSRPVFLAHVPSPLPQSMPKIISSTRTLFVLNGYMRARLETRARHLNTRLGILLCCVMNSKNAYAIHTDYEEILKEINGLEGESRSFKNAASSIIDALRNTSVRLKPLMNRQLFEQDETVLWKNYPQLHEERLSILDLSYEWNHLKDDLEQLYIRA